MLFSSFTFIFIFLPLVWIIFHALKCAHFRHHYTIAKIFLIFSSLFFYAFWKVAYLPILLSSIIVNYVLAKMILQNSKIANGGGGLSLNKLDSAPRDKFTESNRLPRAINCARNDEKTTKFIEYSEKNNIDCHNFASAKSRNDSIRFTPKFYFIVGIIFNLCLLGFFKYTDFLLENFNAFSKLAHLDFDIPLPHILLPLALSFVTFQQIAFLFDCYKRTKGELRENLHIDFVDYALFISFFPQLIAGPIVHHREMMPQFAKMSNLSLGMQFRTCENFGESTDSSLVLSPKFSQIQKPHRKSFDCDSQHESDMNQTQNKNNPSLRGESMDSPKQSTINYEYLAKGIFIFSIGLFKKVFIADSFAKWANAGFGVVEQGGVLNIAESWATSLSYTFQLYFDFSGYCDMAMGLALMFGIVLPLNFDSPYKSLNIAEFWRRWHITLGRFLRECLYIPLGGNRGKGNSSLTRPSREFEKSLLDRQQVLSHADFSAQPTNLTQDTRIANDSQKQSYITKILTLRNLFIVAFLSGIWHGAGWGFVIWGVLHGVAMVIHRIYSWWLDSMANHNNSSLRGSVSKANTTKQSTNHANQNMDCHESLRDSRNDDNRKLCKSFYNGGLFLRFTQTRLYKFLCWFITFNFINIAWIFFRAENLSGAVNLIKGMFGVANVEIIHKWSKIFSTLQAQSNEIMIYLVCGMIVCLVFKNAIQITSAKLSVTKFIIAGFAFAFVALTIISQSYTPPFLYFNF